MMKPIFIVGFPGVGKSTIGPHIAERLNLSYVDTDDFLAQRYHTAVNTMVIGCGIEKFRKRESVVLIELSNKEDIVISTGGGMPTFGDNMDLMVRKGIVIYLSSDPDILAERLYMVRETRPAVADKSLEEVRTYVDQILPERYEYYKKAQITVDATKLRSEEEIKDVFEECVRRIHEYMEKLLNQK